MSEVLQVASFICALMRRDADCETPAGPAAQVAELLVQESAVSGVEPEVLAAVAYHESRFRPRARGAAGEVGMFQVLPRTSRGMGYRFTRWELADLRVNLHVAAARLAMAKKRCGGPPVRWLRHYNGGGCGRARYSTSVTAHIRVAKKYVNTRSYAWAN